MSGSEKQWLRGPRSYYEWLAARMDEHERRAVAAASPHVPHGTSRNGAVNGWTNQSGVSEMLEWDDPSSKNCWA